MEPDRLHHPFDLALPAPELGEIESPAPQSELLEAAISTAAYYQNMTRDANFFAQSCKTQTLAFMETNFQRDDRKSAINLLTKRHKIDWTASNHHITNKHPNLSWSNPDHYIDMVVCVSKDIGVSILLPKERDHTFTFQFDFTKSSRQFSAKFAKLGFDAKSSFLWVGRSSSHDNVFIAWAPTESLTGDGEQVKVGLCTGYTDLSDEHYRITVMFFAFVLEKLQSRRGLCVFEEYPPLDDKDQFSDASNIFLHSPLLNQRDLEELDALIKANYEPWLLSAPDSYRQDSFILDRRPIIVTSQYGQNQPIFETQDDSNSWRRQRRFEEVHYMSVAIATHLRARLSEGLANPIDVETLWNRHPTGLYTTPDHRSRQRITLAELEDLDLLNEEGHEVAIYTVDGFRVNRRIIGFTTANYTPLGVLVNLATVNELFKHNHADDTHYQHGRPGPDDPAVYLYPQAGLRSAGHFQASGLMSSFYPFIELLNEALRDVPDDEDDSRRPIEGVACQAYNSVMHHTRGYGVQHHEAQQGLVTGALGGRFASDEDGKAKCRELVRKCNSCLPHRAFERKISNQDIKRDLRLENVYVIDMTAIREEDRVGNIIFENIIWPLTSLWGHASVRDPLIDHTVLFRPQAYPAIYSWMTYPLTALIEVNWEILKELDEKHLEDEIRLPIQIAVIEVLACAERALNFMHTGNPAVIKTSVMNPLWIGRSIINDGVPSFNQSIVKLSSRDAAKLIFCQWPYDDVRNLPKSTSESALRYRYKELVAGNYMATFSLKVHMDRPIPSALTSLDPRLKRATLCIYTSLMALVFDSQRLVSQGVTKDCKKDLKSPDEAVQKAARDRLVSLTTWQKCKYPFSWEQPGEEPSSTYALLLTMFPTTAGNFNELTRSTTSMSFYSLAKHLVAIITKEKKIEAPLVKNGICSMALRLSVPLVLKLMNDDIESIYSHWARCLEAMKISFLPWRKEGPHTKVPTHENWLFIQRNLPKVPKLLGNSTTAQQIATRVANKDPSVQWNVPKHITEMRSMWEKNVLPLDWDIKNASLSQAAGHEYVSDTYAWVRDNFDGRKTSHRLGIVLAIMFTRLLPDIAPDSKNVAGIDDDPQQMTIKVRELGWIKANHKGVSQVAPFVTMLSTAIIAFLDSDSPLRHHLKDNNNALGNPWTDKHTTKYITPVNLVRLGVAKVVKSASGLLSRAKYGVNWTIENPPELERLWSDLKKCLTTEERFGLYLAFRRVFGETVARAIGTKGQFVVPPKGQ